MATPPMVLSLEVRLAIYGSSSTMSTALSQCAEWTLDKVEKIFNRTFAIKGRINGQLGSLAELARSRPNQLSCLAGRFYAF